MKTHEIARELVILRTTIANLHSVIRERDAELAAVRAGGAKVVAECNDLRAQIRELTTGTKL